MFSVGNFEVRNLIRLRWERRSEGTYWPY